MGVGQLSCDTRHGYDSQIEREAHVQRASARDALARRARPPNVCQLEVPAGQPLERTV